MSRCSSNPSTHLHAGSSREPSLESPDFSGRLPRFPAEASVVLVGVRAAGKTTLAVMAASALKKKIVDVESAFQRSTNYSSPAYSKAHGATQCQKKQGDVLEHVLQTNPRDCIIICSWMERRVQGLLRQFATTHPVIHVMRSQQAIRDCLKIASETKLETFWRTSNAFFRTCSNLEFFNVSESGAADLDPAATTTSTSHAADSPPHLALKKAERHLLNFLSQIYPPGTIPFFESAYPLASVLTEHRRYTYALSIPIEDILQRDFDLENYSAGVDACQITVSHLDTLWPDATYLERYTSMANRITEAVGLARRSSVLPIIVHINHADSSSTSATYLYLDLLSHTLSLVPEMMTVDLCLNDDAISKLVAQKRGSRLIGDYTLTNSFESWHSPIWISQYRRAVELNCDLVRLLKPANAIDDNFDLVHFHAAVYALPGPHLPLTAYNTGPFGRHSAFLNQTLTLVSHGRDISPSTGQGSLDLTAQEATRALYSSFLFDPMKLYVFGANVEYSLSPAMHNAALEMCGIPHRYRLCSTSSLSQVRHRIQDPNFGGASIGLPFKVEFITLADSLSTHAQAIGAINTLIPIRKLDENGSIPTGASFFRGVNRAGPVQALYGENTDWIGIRASIRRGLSPANAVRPTTCALVIGAGGMARAAVYALLQVGVSNIAIYNRTMSNGEKLVEHFKLLLKRSEYQGLGAGGNTKFEVLSKIDDPWQSDFRLPSVIISCIPTHPIGDVPSPEFQLPESWLGNQTGGVVFELGYKTLDTPLLRQAVAHANRGWVAMDGLDLLPDQGFAQFELFTGRRAPRRVMRRAIIDNYPGQHPDQYERSNPEELRRRLRKVVE